MRLRARLYPLLPVALIALGAFCAGCGGGHDAMEKQLSELRAEVVRLRATQAALTERVDTIDIERGAFAKGASAPAGAVPAGTGAPSAGAPRAPGSDRPELDVVRLSPSEGDGDADGNAAVPLIRAVGNEGSVQRQTLSNKSGARGAPKKGVATATPTKRSDDARPVVKP